MICSTCGGEMKVNRPSGVILQKSVGFAVLPDGPVPMQEVPPRPMKDLAGSAHCPTCDRPLG